MSTILEAEEIYTSFHSHKKRYHAVRGASLYLKEGESLGIVGESGCGKSAFAKTLTRLLPKTATIDGGRVIYKGLDLLKLRGKEINHIRGKEIGMIFQDPLTSLNPTMKIGEQIMEGYAFHHPEVSKSERIKHCIEVMEQVGISDPDLRIHQYPHELSGGMRQRVNIAIAILLGPPILIADEPTTALDVTVQAQILQTLSSIQASHTMSIILITHNLSLVANFCDRALVMYAGEIVESGCVHKLFSNPSHPYTKRLLRSFPHIEHSPDVTLHSISGSPPDLSCETKGCSFAERCLDTHSKCLTTPPRFVQVDRNHFSRCHLNRPKRDE